MSVLAVPGATATPAPTEGDPGAPSGNGVQPTVIDGNPTCLSVLGPSSSALAYKLDPPLSGTYPISVGPLTGTLTITFYDIGDDHLLDFQLSGGIAATVVLVKGGDRANRYNYAPPTQADTLLHPPVNASGNYATVSHVDFCLVEANYPSTTLSMDTSGLDVSGISSYDAGTNTLIVRQGTPVTLPVTETNDGNVPLTNVYVEFAGASCAGGNELPDPAVVLNPGEDTSVACTFAASLGTSVVTATGHGTFQGKDVTSCAPRDPRDNVICDQDEYAEITVIGINPSTDLSLDALSSTPATQTGVGPDVWTVTVNYGGNVDLAFSELNDGTTADDTLTGVWIEFIGGAPQCDDTASAVTLLANESHDVSCATITGVTAGRTITAIGHGTDGLGNDVTWCRDPSAPPAGTTCDQDEIVTVNIVVNFGQGCTPGLWRQYDQYTGKGKTLRYHWIRGHWAASPYSYSNNAGTTFGVAAWNGYTLGQLSQLGGGGLNALGRHASAALQNVMHPGITYGGYATGDAASLIADVQAAVAGGTASIEALHIRLADYNEQGDCPLSNS